MELKDAILKRRSIRKFSDVEVSEEEIKELLIAGMAAPSAVNKKPWEFYVIKSKEKLEELRKHGAPFGKMKAPLAIVVCGNKHRFLPFKMSEFWVQDCSAATENILLRAVDLGLGACWCGVYPNDLAVKSTRKVIEAKDNIIPLNVIWIGHGTEEKEERSQFEEKYIHTL